MDEPQTQLPCQELSALMHWTAGQHSSQVACTLELWEWWVFMALVSICFDFSGCWPCQSKAMGATSENGARLSARSFTKVAR